jgi:DNA-binding SARP family transcriptional activator/tetratricopeptide (TPR) repeat protein
VSRLALYLLGPPRIECDDASIQVDTRKAVALLAYLAVTSECHRRASLVNLLWPEYDRTRGRAALRRTLYALNKALDGAWLEVSREEIGLNAAADIWVDVNRFRQNLAECEHHGHGKAQVCPDCVTHLVEAVALVRGQLLSGFGLRDSVNFDDWAFFQGETLRRELIGALDQLVHWHVGQREFEPAVGYARRRLALDPLDEQAHCRLMQLYAWSGQRSAALTQYEHCAKVLGDQLGVPPQDGTTELYESIKIGSAPPLPVAPSCLRPEQRAGEPAPLASGSRAAVLARIPPFLAGEDAAEPAVFVARKGELAKLATFLEATLAGRGQVAFITGDAGSGKTALIQEFARQAQADHPDLIVAGGHGNAHTGAGDPYLPFREILGLLTGDVKAHWAAGAMTGEQARRLWQLFPLMVQAFVETGPDLVDLFVAGASLLRRASSYTGWSDGSAWQVELEKLVARQAAAPNLQQCALFDQYGQVLQAVARQRPLLLALDDLQWADAGSVDLLFHLGRRLEGHRILLLGAYRPAEVALGWPASSPLAAPGSGTVRDGRQGLSSVGGAVGEIGGERARHPLQPVVNELRRTFGEIEVDLHQAEGRQFVEAYLDSEPNQLGDAFRETLHQRTVGIPLFTVELLRGMKDRGNLVCDAQGRWIEGSALDWETLPAKVEAVIAERIDRLPARLREFLTVASVEGETFTAEVAAQVTGTGVHETVRCLSDALDRKHRLVSAQQVLQVDGQHLSRYRFRHILFQRHLYSSLDRVSRVHLHQAVEYLYQAGRRAQRLYANTEAVEYLRRALALLEDASAEGMPEGWLQEKASQIRESLGDVLEWMGDHDQARIAYREALGQVPDGDPIGKSQLHRKVGNIWRLQSRYERALRAYTLAGTALEEGTLDSTPAWWEEWVQIRLERMWMHYWLGQWRAISNLADQVRPVVEQRGTPSQCISYFLCLASMNNRRDRYVVSKTTLDLCRTALAISQEVEDQGEIAWARFMLGFSQLWSGDLAGAEQQMQLALALAEDTGDVVHQSRCLTYLTILYRKRGEVRRARQYAVRGLAAAMAGKMVEYSGMTRANLAWVAWQEGDLAGAEAEGRAALELWQKLPAGHSSCAFQWTALWPLLAVTLAQNQLSEASQYARALLEPTQQCLPEELTTLVQKAVHDWGSGASQEAALKLSQALELARELGYL